MYYARTPARGGAGGGHAPRVEQPGGLRNPSWEAFFGLGQRKPPRPRKESRFGWFNMPGISFIFTVRHRYVGIPCTLRDWGAVFFAQRRFAPERLCGLLVGRPRAQVVQPDGWLTSWEAFFGPGQRKPPRPRKESRFGWFNLPGNSFIFTVRHRYVGIP